VLGGAARDVDQLDRDVRERDEVALRGIEDVRDAAAVAVGRDGQRAGDPVALGFDQDTFLAMLHGPIIPGVAFGGGTIVRAWWAIPSCACTPVTDHRQGGLGSWRGHEELLAYYAGICDSARELREDLSIVAERDGVIVADCMFHARLTDDGPAEEFSLPYGLVVVVRDSLIQELGVHQDAAAATQAASMPETS